VCVCVCVCVCVSQIVQDVLAQPAEQRSIAGGHLAGSHQLAGRDVLCSAWYVVGNTSQHLSVGQEAAAAARDGRRSCWWLTCMSEFGVSGMKGTIMMAAVAGQRTNSAVTRHPQPSLSCTQAGRSNLYVLLMLIADSIAMGSIAPFATPAAADAPPLVCILKPSTMGCKQEQSVTQACLFINLVTCML
jgi:hypothetical protein